MKISIIIPVYNLELYIKKCIESVLKQTYKNIEIVIVNDGSIDSSEEICKNYVQLDNRVKYYSKKNGGASSARNYGLKKATGDYVMFIDGDDFLYNEKVVEKLVEKLFNSDEDNNILFYRMSTYYDKIKKYEVDAELFEHELDNINNQIFEKLVENGRFSISPCDKLIKLKYIKDNEIYFDENMRSCEDIDWSFRLYLKNKKYSLTNEVVYVYRKQRENSTTYKITETKITEMYKVIKKWLDYNYENEFIKKIYINYLAYQYGILISLINKNNCHKKMKKYTVKRFKL